MAHSKGSMLIFASLILVWLILASVMIVNSVVLDKPVSDEQLTTLSVVGSPALLVISSLVKEREKRTEVELELAHSGQAHTHRMEAIGGGLDGEE